MTLAVAIRQAAHAGWNAPEWRGCVDVKVEAGDPLTAFVWGVSSRGDVTHGLPLAVVLLDASFWRALGRAQGWRGRRWRLHWRQLIETLADGRSIDDFFSGLGDGAG